MKFLILLMLILTLGCSHFKQAHMMSASRSLASKRCEVTFRSKRMLELNTKGTLGRVMLLGTRMRKGRKPKDTSTAKTKLQLNKDDTIGSVMILGNKLTLTEKIKRLLKKQPRKNTLRLQKDSLGTVTP